MGNPWNPNEAADAARAARERDSLHMGLAGYSDGSLSGQVGKSIWDRAHGPLPRATGIHTTSAPASFSGTVRAMAWLGLVAGLAYGWLWVGPSSWAAIVAYAGAGVVLGVLAGAALYLVIVILRALARVLAVMLKIAIVLALIAGALYLFVP